MIAGLGLKSIVQQQRATAITFARCFRTAAPVANASVASAHAAAKELTTKPNPDPLLAEYPDFKPELYFDRDPYNKYDDQQNRRNFDEPLHINDDMLNMWSPDYYQPVSDATGLKYNAVFFGGIGIFAATLYYFFYPEKPAMPRNYPHGGLAQALGASGEEDAPLYAARIDKTA